MNELELRYEVDHEKRVFRARNDNAGLVFEGASREDLRYKVRDGVRAHFAGKGDTPRTIVLRDELGGVVEQIVLGGV